MTPKNSDYSSDESQPSEGMEEEIMISRSTGSSVNTTDVISPPSSSSSVSPVSYCDNSANNTNGRSSNNKRKQETTFPETCSGMKGSVTIATNKAESISSSLSVPSSPEPTISPPCHNNNNTKEQQMIKDSPVAYLYSSPRNNHNSNMNNRYLSPPAYAMDVPRTAPCIVLSPNVNHPVLFNHHNATFNPSSPSLMMSHHPHHPHLHINHPPPFQMFHHHQSTLMSKINPLCFKTIDVGMQRFREFCADHNFNSVGSGFKTVKCNNNNNSDDQESEEREGDKKRPKESYEDKGTNSNNNNDKEETNTNDKSLRSQSSSESPAVMKRLSFGIDRILAETEKANGEPEKGLLDEEERNNNSKDPISKRSLVSPSSVTRQQILYQHHNQHNHHHHQNSNLLNNNSSDNIHNSSHRLHCLSSSSSSASSPLNLTNRCTDCYLLGRFCRNSNNNGTSTHANLHYPSLVSSSSGVISGGGGGGSNNSNGVSASFSPWMTNASIYENSPLLSPSAYHTQSTLTSAYNMGNAGYSTMSSLVSCNNNVGPGGRRKRSWSRAVFSSLQRKGLEKRFQIQKYITKPDRRQLAATLGLTDAQVKVWFQNRRMKWRHSKEGKVTSGIGDEGISVSTTVISSGSNSSGDGQKSHPIIIGASSSSTSSAIVDMKT